VELVQVLVELAAGRGRASAGGRMARPRPAARRALDPSEVNSATSAVGELVPLTDARQSSATCPRLLLAYAVGVRRSAGLAAVVTATGARCAHHGRTQIMQTAGNLRGYVQRGSLAVVRMQLARTKPRVVT
jgi:hypothetical protein